MNRGCHGGLSARAISKLLRTSYYKTKKYLNAKYIEFSMTCPVVNTAEEEFKFQEFIGDIIYEYRTKKTQRSKELDQPSSLDAYLDGL